MKRNTLIVLCSLIAVLAAIIVAGVSYLYSGVDSETKHAADKTVVDKAEVADTDPMEEDAQSEPEAASEKSPEKQPEQPSAVKAAAPAEFTVTNCGTGKQNTIRQNADNSLELIDEKGKSLWKMSLPGQIAGAVGQVDYYSNGKIQFLFCQGNKLHLVDRLGREVRGFPMTMPYEVILGPSKAVVKGKTYWRADTGQGPVYVIVMNKQTKILTDIPK